MLARITSAAVLGIDAYLVLEPSGRTIAISEGLPTDPDAYWNTNAIGMNLHRTVVGVYWDSWRPSVAWAWSPQSGLQFLPGLGGDFTNAHAVNDEGVVVGQALLPEGQGRAVRWDASPH